jgi:hypothetical protein
MRHITLLLFTLEKGKRGHLKADIVRSSKVRIGYPSLWLAMTLIAVIIIGMNGVLEKFFCVARTHYFLWRNNALKSLLAYA